MATLAQAYWRKLHDLVCGKDCNHASSPEQQRISAALAAEEFEGLRLAIGLRFVAIAVVAVLLWSELGLRMLLGLAPWLCALGLSGYLQLLLRQPPIDRRWMHWLFPLLDMGLIAGAIAMRNPFDLHPLPAPLMLNFDTVLYFALFLALSALGQSVRAVVITALAAAAAWLAASLYIANLPGVLFDTEPRAQFINLPVAEKLSFILDPWRVPLTDIIRRVTLILLLGAVLAVAALRGRRLMARQVEAERARRNLARHFSPHVAAELATMDETLGAVRKLDAAVLFADLVGFTQLSEELTPEQTIHLLREVHGRLAQAVFENEGTLDKYLGDGIMASFGTPKPGPRDASSALLAARAMLRAMEHLNRQRRLLRQPPLELAIGLHFGPVTLGNIGDENRLEYALIGETVNVSHRLEQMTRALNARLCLSEAFVAKLNEETRGDINGIRDLVPLRAQAIRGLRDRMAVWMLPRGTAEADEAVEATPTIH